MTMDPTCASPPSVTLVKSSHFLVSKTLSMHGSNKEPPKGLRCPEAFSPFRVASPAPTPPDLARGLETVKANKPGLPNTPEINS